MCPLRLPIARERAKYHFDLRSERPHSAPRKRQSVRQPPYGLLTAARECHRFGFGRRKAKQKDRALHDPLWQVGERWTPCVSTYFARERAKFHFALRSERPHSALRKRQSVRQPPYGLLTVAREYRRFGFGRRRQNKRTVRCTILCGKWVSVGHPVSTHFARERAKYHFDLRSERPHSASRKRQSVRQQPYDGLLTVAREYRRFGFGRRNQIKRTTHKAWFF